LNEEMSAVESLAHSAPTLRTGTIGQFDAGGFDNCSSRSPQAGLS
jgi:hypothetical protein